MLEKMLNMQNKTSYMLFLMWIKTNGKYGKINLWYLKYGGKLVGIGNYIELKN